MSDGTENRRPIQSRNWRFFQFLAARLARTGITPNMISVSSIGFAIAAGVLMASTRNLPGGYARILWVVAAICVQGRLVANLLDGMVAIEGGKSSPVGELFNEVPDRISDSAIFIGAGYALSGLPELGLVAALISVFVAYVRAMGTSVGVGQVFLGPMAKPHRMAVLTAVCCVNAIVPDRAFWVHRDTAVGWISIALMVIIVGGLLTAGRRLRYIAKRMREISRHTELGAESSRV